MVWVTGLAGQSKGMEMEYWITEMESWIGHQHRGVEHKQPATLLDCLGGRARGKQV